MKRPVQALIILLLHTWASHAQDTTSHASVVPGCVVTVAPLAVFDLFGSLLPFGVEKNVYRRWSVRAEVGIPLYTFGVYPTEGVRPWHIYGDYRATFAVRHYYKQKHENTLYYLNAEVFLREQRVDQEEHGDFTEYSAASHTTYYYNAARYYRSAFGWAVGGGLCTNVRKRVYIEWFWGIGLRYVSIQHSDISGLRTTTESDEELLFRIYPVGAFSANGRSIRLHMPVGFRVAYALGRR